MRVISRRAVEFACTTKACAPPPVGTGGSNSGGSGSKSSYGSDKLKKAGAAGPDLDIEWKPSEGNLTLRGVVTTAGGRKFAVEWDEFDVGPKTADQIIDQYAKLLDLYPDAPAVPLALGLDAAQSMFSKTFSSDPYYKPQIAELHDKAHGYVVNDVDTKAPLMMAFSSKIDRRRDMFAKPEEWGSEVFGLSNDRHREYIVTHEFGHVVQQHAMSRMSPGQRAVAINNIGIKIDDAKQKGGVTDVGTYALSKPVEMFAEAFAVQSLGLSKKNTSFLRDVTDPFLAGEAPRRVEWTA